MKRDWLTPKPYTLIYDNCLVPPTLKELHLKYNPDVIIVDSIRNCKTYDDVVSQIAETGCRVVLMCQEPWLVNKIEI